MFIFTQYKVKILFIHTNYSTNGLDQFKKKHFLMLHCILSMHSVLNSGFHIDNIWVFPVGLFFTFGSPHIFRAV